MFSLARLLAQVFVRERQRAADQEHTALFRVCIQVRRGVHISRVRAAMRAISRHSIASLLTLQHKVRSPDVVWGVVLGTTSQVRNALNGQVAVLQLHSPVAKKPIKMLDGELPPHNGDPDAIFEDLQKMLGGFAGLKNAGVYPEEVEVHGAEIINAWVDYGLAHLPAPHRREKQTEPCPHPKCSQMVTVRVNSTGTCGRKRCVMWARRHPLESRRGSSYAD